MTSPKKIESNLRNAKLSTGPRTLEGKNRSRKNALTHGLTARIVLLADERQPDFGNRMNGWFKSLQPQDLQEVYLAERAVYCSWQLDRATRARSAQTYLTAHTGKFVEQNRLELEVAGYSQILFRAPYGRPVACPTAELPEGEAGKTWQGNFEAADHPALIVKRMEDSGLGCLWLLARWDELRAMVEMGAGWRAPERFRAFRLLGIHAIDAYMTADLASLLQACQVLDPTAGSLVSEIWNELVPADALPGLEESYQQQVRYLPAMDQDAAREYLLAIVTRQTTRLEVKAWQLAEAAEIKAELAPHLGASDFSREGQLMLRYELLWEKSLRQNLGKLKELRSEMQKRGDDVIGYLPPSREWFKPACDPDESADRTEQDDCIEPISWRPKEGEYVVEEETLRNEANEVEGGPRNEPNGAGGGLRNEANEVEGGLRNEANGEEGGLRNEANEVEGGLRKETFGPAEGGVGDPRPTVGHAEGPTVGHAEGGVGEPRPTGLLGGVEEGLRDESAGYVAPPRFDRLMEAALKYMEGQPRPAILHRTRADGGHGRAVGGSRRERRKRNKEAARGK
jgi:hypothetical protein